MIRVTVAGIDPGISGGITVLRNWKIVPVPHEGENGGGHLEIQDTISPQVVMSCPMPTIKTGTGKTKIDAQSLRVLLEESEVDYIAIEKVGAMPGQGVTSMFSFGYGAGVIEGVVASLVYNRADTVFRPPYEFVTPQAWMKDRFKGMAQGDHKASPLYCSRRFPNSNWLATPRSKKPHDGMTDSACIADYLLTKLTK